MGKTRILLWHWGRRGGGPRYTLELARVLAQDPELEVHLSLSRQSELFADFEALDLPGFHLDTYSDRKSALLALLRLPTVRRDFQAYLVKQQIQVVDCTMTHLWNVAIAPQIRAVGIPYLLTLHDAAPHPGDNYFVRQTLLQWEIQQTRGIIALTQHVRNQAEQLYHLPSSQSWVAPLGVFPYGETQLSPRTYPHDRPLRLLFFGRILPYKGLPLLVEAFASLRTQFPELVLEIVGMGSGSYVEQLRTEPGIQVDCRWIPESEIGAIFAKADLLVLPYIEASQSGSAVIALGCGLPIAATPVGGLQEQVEHQVTGMVAETVTAPAIAEAIRQLIQNPDLYERCSAGALHKVQRELSWGAIGAKISQILRSVARESLPTQPS